jgi:hypothetical protein
MYPLLTSKLATLMPQPPKCWDHRYASICPTHKKYFLKMHPITKVPEEYEAPFTYPPPHRDTLFS